jgi:alkanesulfonate monooxygenase SsuD/methylene tetrahydromethanopterin reductase-like flavin-dependent oxidoreductase (luciferase family)
MQYGLSMMPMHLPEKPLRQAVEEDIDLLMRADALGYSEAWIGEHFTSPDLYTWGGNGYTAKTFPGRRGLAKDAGSTS